MSKIIANYIAYWKRAFDFKGRSSRSEYWYAVLGTIIVSLIIMIVLAFIGGIFNVIGISFSGAASVIYSVYYILSYIASISLSVRRLHDIGLTGWLYLIMFTGIGSIALLVMACIDSQAGYNQWGENPKHQNY